MLAWRASLHQVVFMPGWSAFAESAEAAVGVEALGLVWPGTEPKASQGFLAAPYRYYRLFVCFIGWMVTSNPSLYREWSSHRPKSSTHPRVGGLYTHYKDFRDGRWDDHPYIDPALTQVIGFWQMSEVWRRLASKGFVTWSVWQKDVFENWRSFCYDICFFEKWDIELIVGMDTFALAMENMEWRWIWCGNRGWVIIVTLFHSHNVLLMVLDGCGKFGDGWTEMHYGWWSGNNMAPKNGDGWFRWFSPSTGWFSGSILVFGGVSRIISWTFSIANLAAPALPLLTDKTTTLISLLYN